MPARPAKRDLLQYLRSFKSLSSATAIIRTSGPVQRTWTALLIGKAMLPSTSPSDVRWAGCNRMLAVGHLATASRDREVQAWLGRDFVDRDKDLHQISTGNHLVVPGTINSSTFMVPVPSAAIRRQVTRMISRTVVGHKVMSSAS